MKKAPPVRLSLRKLFVAMLAVGPVAILPSPLSAVVPQGTTAPFTQSGGTGATWSGSGTTGTITVPNNNSILVWGTTAGTVAAPYLGATDGTTFSNFNIATGETFLFSLPAGGNVLNKVSVGTNTTNSIFNGLGAAAAVINGSIIAPNGKVFILSTSGNIIVGSGAQVTTGQGLVLSTLAEANDNTFIGTGSLAANGTSNGNIFLGSGGVGTASVVGNLSAYAGNITANALSVSGNLVLNHTSTTSNLILSGASSSTTVSGNLTINSGGGVQQGGGAVSVIAGNTAITTGNMGVLLNGSSNDFKTVTLNVGTANTAGDAVIRDSNSIELASSTIGNNLTVNAGVDITTVGAVAVGNTVALNSTSGNITFANSSSVGNSSIAGSGSLGATTNGGAITVNTVGNLTTGNISAGTGTINVTTGNVLTVNGTIATGGNIALVASTVTGTATGQIGVSAGLSSGSVSVTANGSGYTAVPTVTITGGGGTGATATATTNVVTVSVSNSGTGYTAVPTVTITGGTTSATANATANVATIPVSTNGVGYTALPTVTISAAPTGGTNATASAVGNLTSIPVATAGSGYTAAPTVTITGGGATTAATATSTLAVNAIPVTAGGTGYSANPVVQIVNGGGTGATATATVVGGAITAIVITNAGSGYTSVPTVNILDATGTGATAGTTDLKLGAITVSAGGSGFTSAPTVALGTVAGSTAGTLGSPALQVTNINVTAAGSGYTAAPTVTLGTVTGSTAATLGAPTLRIAAVNVSNSGSGFTATPTVTFSTVTGATVAQAAPTLRVSSVTVTNIGSGYTSAPTVAFSTSGGSGATATVPVIFATSTPSVTVNSTVGDVTLPGVTATNLLVGSAGNITQVGSTIITAGANASTDVMFNAVRDITLANGQNALAGVVSVNGNTVSLASRTGFTLGASNVNGSSLTINTVSSTAGTGGIVLGAGQGTATENINILNGGLNIFTNASTVDTDDYSRITVFGAATVNTTGGNSINTANAPLAGGVVTFDAQANSPAGRSFISVGQWNIDSGTAATTISENTTVNLGTIRANALNVRSTSDVIINGAVTIGTAASTWNTNSGGGDISNGTGSLTIGNATNAGAITFNLSTGDLQLTSASNSLNNSSITLINGINDVITSTTPIRFITNNVVGANSSVTANYVGTPGANTIIFGNSGTSNVTNVTLVSTGDVLVGGGTLSIARLTINVTGNVNQGSSGFTQMNNTLTLTAGGNVNMDSVTNNMTGNVVLSNTVGDVAINSSRNLTISGTGGNVSVRAGASGTGGFSNTWNVILGNLNVKSLTANALNGAANDVNSGNSGNITQSNNASLHVEGTSNLTTFNGDITLANNGNSYSRFNASTGGALGVKGSGNITMVKDPTMRVGNIFTNGNVSLTSRFGSVFEDDRAAVTLNVSGTLNANAPAGSILLGNATGLTVADITAATVNAAGSAAITSNNATITLGNTHVNALTVNAVGNIAQSTPLWVFGSATFNSTGGNITLTDQANSFGPVSIMLGSQNRNAAVTEVGTLNLRQVSMPGGGNGTFTATSLNGDIFDSGLGGVKVGGNSTAMGSGVVTLNAPAGNISLTNPTSDILTFGGLAFNGKDVTISVLGTTGATLFLGAANTTSIATGNLSVTSFQGDIGSVGAVRSSGNATFTAATGNITLTQANTGFGPLKFNGKLVTITESGTMSIVTGSQATGAAILTAGGDIEIVNAGGLVNFFSVATLTATGNITLPKLIQAAGQLTVKHTGTANLSALSLSNDLPGSNAALIDQGTGTYIPPSQ